MIRTLAFAIKVLLPLMVVLVPISWAGQVLALVGSELFPLNHHFFICLVLCVDLLT